VKFTVDGEPQVAAPGRTVAAALIAMGKSSWRVTRTDARRRGVFCGIGVCFDCLVVVNEVADVRACQRFLADGDDIRTQYGVESPR